MALKVYNIKTDFGAQGNGQKITTNVSITNGGTLLTVSTGGTFVAGDNNKFISFTTTDLDTGRPIVFSSTITTPITGTTVTLTNAFTGTTMAASSQSVEWGTNDTSAFNGASGFWPTALAWQTGHPTDTFELDIPAGRYVVPNPSAEFVVKGLKTVTVVGSGSAIISDGQISYGLVHLANEGVVAGSTNAPIHTVSAGASSVTLINSADASNFSVNDWTVIAGFEMQSGGFPPNPFFFEYVQIIGISGGVITFSAPLAYGYKETWPLYATDVGQPATLYVLDQSWNATVEWQGITFDIGAYPAGGLLAQQDCTGRSTTFRNCTWSSTTANPAFPTMNQSFQMIGCTLTGSAVEIDKMNASIIYDSCAIGAINMQSANNELTFRNGTTLNALSGTPKTLTVSDSTISQFSFGPNLYGRTESATFTNSIIGFGATTNFDGLVFPGPTNVAVDVGGATMSGGTLTMANSLFGGTRPTNGTAQNAAGTVAMMGWAVPGTNCVFYDGNRSCLGMFRVLDVTADSTNTYISTTWTGNSGAFPLYTTGPLRIATHPCPNITVRNCSATAPAGTNDNSIAWSLSQAPANKPIWSYFKHVYSGANGTQDGQTLWGNLNYLKANVTATYGGVDANPLFGPLGSFVWWTQTSTALGTAPGGSGYVPNLDVRPATGTGERTVTYTGGDYAVAGTKGNDSGFAPPNSPLLWIANSVAGYFPHTAGSLSVLVEINTDQGIPGIPAGGASRRAKYIVFNM